jgi:PQQ-like domain
MKTGRALAVASLLLGVACRPTPPRTNDSGPAEAAHETPTRSATPTSSAPGGLTEKTMKSYSTTWASPTRNSRVAAPRRRFETIERVAALAEAPQALLVNEAGDHVALDLGARYEVRDASGKVGAQGTKPQKQPIVLWATTVLIGANELDFAGKGWSAQWPTARSVSLVSKDADKAWALWTSPTDAFYVVQKAPQGFPHHSQLPDGQVIEVYDQSPWTLQVAAGRFLGDSPMGFASRRSAHLAGQGCGAIGDDGRIAVAMSDKRFFLYDGNQATTDGTLHQVAATALDFVPTDISVVDGGFALLAGGSGAVGLHLLDTTGKELWRTTIAFAVDAPPIDAGGGRVYLAGAGFAAAEGGKVLWSHPSSSRVFATALGDGSALVAVGAELRATSRDGAIVQTLRVPDGDSIVAPPAVAADGTAWVATAKGLYAAR